jgi:flagellar biosynthesis protein FlhF
MAGASPDFSDALSHLAGNEVAPELARAIVDGATTRIGDTRVRPASAQTVQQKLVEEMAERFQVQASLGRSGCSTRITALVGPPGVGKTTTLVKLAVNYGLAARKPVLILSMDNYRVAATEQLRTYATILGVGFQVLETVTALAQSIEEHRGKDLILIDTPGFAAADMESAAPLARFLATRADIDTQLVLSASTKSSDLRRIADGFEVFAPHRLIFTRLDETNSYGQILSESVRTGKALSFFSTGQRIPEDLREASPSELIELVLHGASDRWSRAA